MRVGGHWGGLLGSIIHTNGWGSPRDVATRDATHGLSRHPHEGGGGMAASPETSSKEVCQAQPRCTIHEMCSSPSHGYAVVHPDALRRLCPAGDQRPERP
eukprot:gene16620-biopygen14336